ncbi:hypothetical protein NDU88_004890 [Pleurodeles waltl]|uniref:Uncharacterized protein n=1 Tax=Pleurodeles waltl TaxID=8319 RepID=A0AAV7V2Z8_PLEWA|nr:hypothetical protein NDU88_004890 [Pleurodeles waltl]
MALHSSALRSKYGTGLTIILSRVREKGPNSSDNAEPGRVAGPRNSVAPTHDETYLEPRQAMEAVACLSGTSMGSPSRAVDDSEPDSLSRDSGDSSLHMPHVMPGTSDDII